MSDRSRIVVLKFGSSVLRNEEDLAKAVHEIYRWWRNGSQVIAVVSALGNTTDNLLSAAETVCEKPAESSLAVLLSTGETTCSALLGLALKKVGIPARVIDAVQTGLRTTDDHLDADLIDVDLSRLQNEARKGVVVLPGFVGRRQDDEVTLLGRGGSDYTALFLAHKLKAHCVLVKDVDGLYTGDPACAVSDVRRFSHVGYDTAIRLGGSLVQPKAVRFAAQNRLTFAVSCIGAATATEVGPFPDRLATSDTDRRPLRVLLVGCGTVGGGVYQRLVASPEYFEVKGVVTNTGARAHELGVPVELIKENSDELLDPRHIDVVIELTGSVEHASTLAGTTLSRGIHFVTANKRLISVEGESLRKLASSSGASLRYSATVGGVLPAIETIEQALRRGPIRKLSGVLNGTTNFILNRIESGEDLSAAIVAAREAGYAEADPLLDLNGTDTTQKLILLARRAFGVELRFDEVDRKGIEDIDPKWVQGAKLRSRRVKLVAECSRSGGAFKASVHPVEVSMINPMATLQGVENCLIVENEVGEPLVVFGDGAGRWPTTESVIADLFDLRVGLETSKEREVAIA